jgi:NitT/TauT family transport system permease protein
MASETSEKSAQLSSLEAGLDALEQRNEQGRPVWRKVLSTVLPPVIGLLVLLLIWDAVVAAQIKPGYILPGPADVWDELTAKWGPDLITQAIWGSVRRAAIGYGAALVIGTVLGLGLGQSKLLRKTYGPLLSGLQSLPSVAWVPVAIVWFGVTPATIYTVVLLGAVPSIAIGLMDGMDRVPPIYLSVGRNLGARGFDSIWFVMLPAAMPGYVSGLKQGWAFAWRSLMAAELIAISPALGPGIGQVLDQASTLQDMSLAFGTIIVILLIGIGINMIFFAPLERHLLRSRGLART